MSVFRGGITEYPGVVADNFNALNVQRGRAFFLSHCHKDHMTGLDSPQLLAVLKARSGKLYCSEVTRNLLHDNPFFESLRTFLNALPMNEPVAMTIEPPTTAESEATPLHFTVTLLPAGHCPGSTMFLFQGRNGNVLYTGDFRLTLEETKKLSAIHNGNSVLAIRTLYLDTTFCHPVATKIPSRDVSRDCVLKIVGEWLGKSPLHTVHLKCAMFGYEHIIMAVSQRFKTRVHIAAWRLAAYQHLPAVAQCLTLDGSSTRIHCCNYTKGGGRRRGGGLPCGVHRDSSVLMLKPSTMWFLGSSTTELSEPFVYQPEFGFCRVLHSMHASYGELCSFVRYLSPQRLVPCVVPVGDSSLRDVHSRLKALLPQLEVVTDSSVTPTESRAAHLSSRSHGLRRRQQREASPETDSEWSSSEDGADTIDEFPSSEDVARPSPPPPPPLPAPLPRHLSLPSMLTSTLTSYCAPPSSPKARLATPIDQTPLDLSVESTDSVTTTSPRKEQSNTDQASGTRSNGSRSPRDELLRSTSSLPCSSNKVENQIGPSVGSRSDCESQSKEASPAGISFSVLPASAAASIDSTGLVEGRLTEEVEEMLGSSYDDALSSGQNGGSIEELYISSDSEASSGSRCSTPVAKRLKTVATSTPNKQCEAVFIDLTQDSPPPQSDRGEVTLIEDDSLSGAELSSEDDQDSSGGIEIIECVSPTPRPTHSTQQRPDSHQTPSRHTDTSADHHTRPPSPPLAPNEATPDVIILDDSSPEGKDPLLSPTAPPLSSPPPHVQTVRLHSQEGEEEEEGGGGGGAGLGSPLYLPPTPGREAVDSILTRTAFF